MNITCPHCKQHISLYVDKGPAKVTTKRSRKGPFLSLPDGYGSNIRTEDIRSIVDVYNERGLIAAMAQGGISEASVIRYVALIRYRERLGSEWAPPNLNGNAASVVLAG